MLLEQVKRTIEDKKLIDKGDKVLICVSGGPDSMALLDIFVHLRRLYDNELVVAHLDHMLRGRHSKADADFVKRYAEKLKIPIAAEKIDAKALARAKKMSMEEAAREARYDFFQRIAKNVGAVKIATAHNMDDQAETVLMRFIKGSGSLGLSGIPYKRRLGNFYVIRPFLDIKREGIERYLRARKIPWRIDRSNLKTLYLRNKLRRNLIPLLEKDYNPRIKENLVSISRNLNDEFDYLTKAASRICDRIISYRKGCIEIALSDLERQHIALQRLIARQIIAKIKGDLNRIEYKHWLEIESMLRDKNRKSLDLPDGIGVRRFKEKFIFKKKDSQERILPLKRVYRLKVPGNIDIPELEMNIRAEIVKRAPIFKKGKRQERCEYINGDIIGPTLSIRTWRLGDRMIPLGMESAKKLHDIFIDDKIPKTMRNRIPLVLSGDKILWIVGVKLSQYCRILGTTKKIVKLIETPLSSL